LHALRRTKERSTEEIDVVGTARNVVTVIGEARWGTAPMEASYLDTIEAYKIPALRQNPGMKVAKTPHVLLFSRAGYTDGLRAAADGRDDVTLVDVAALLDT
jgi:hypothetical protein